MKYQGKNTLMNTKTKNSRKNWNFHFLNFGRLWDENSWLTPVHRFKFIGTGVNQAFWTLNNQCNMNVSSSIAHNCYGGDNVQKKTVLPIYYMVIFIFASSLPIQRDPIGRFDRTYKTTVFLRHISHHQNQLEVSIITQYNTLLWARIIIYSIVTVPMYNHCSSRWCN